MKRISKPWLSPMNHKQTIVIWCKLGRLLSCSTFQTISTCSYLAVAAERTPAWDYGQICQTGPYWTMNPNLLYSTWPKLWCPCLILRYNHTSINKKLGESRDSECSEIRWSSIFLSKEPSNPFLPKTLLSADPSRPHTSSKSPKVCCHGVTWASAKTRKAVPKDTKSGRPSGKCQNPVKP